MNKVGKFIGGALAVAGGVWTARAAMKALHALDLEGKIVLITGGSRGLGLVLARHLAANGARIAICARSKAELSEAAKDLRTYTRDMLTLPCDITSREEVRRMLQSVKAKMGGLDILINNAGIIQVGPEENMTEEDYKAAMEVHFWGPFYTMQEAVPLMEEREGGRIVNIVSIGGKVSVPHLLPYNASKFALSGLSEGMTAELSRKNIYVTTVYPGLMRTGSPRNIDVKGKHEKEYAWFKISASLPMLSMNADTAARKIIKAMRCGDKVLTLGFPAKLAVALHSVAPGLNISFFDLINKLLPDPPEEGKIKKAKKAEEGTAVSEKRNRSTNVKKGTKSKKGYESRSRASETRITAKTDKAAAKNNEK